MLLNIVLMIATSTKDSTDVTTDDSVHYIPLYVGHSHISEVCEVGVQCT